MKQTQYTEHIEKIKCSDEFKEKMERRLSASPSEVHEYEDSVHGVERAERFRMSRFAAVAAALVIIAGGGAMGYNSMRNIRPNDPASSLLQQESDFPYQEIFDLYNSQQIHGTAVYKNIGLWDISGFETGEMTNERFESLISNFEMNNWNTVEARDMSDTKGMQDVTFILHPDGYERFTGVYYIFQILENNDAYFIKYDMADDSLADHIVSEYCYQFTEGTFERYRDILRSEDATVSEDETSADKSDSPSLVLSDSMNVQQLSVNNFSNGSISAVEKAVTESANSEIMDILRNFPWETAPHEEANEENMQSALNATIESIAVLLDEEKEIRVVVGSHGKMITNTEDGTVIVYDAGTDIFERIKEIADGLENVAPFNGEMASQEEIDSFVDEGIRKQMYYHFDSPLMKEVPSNVGGFGMTVDLNKDAFEAIKEKLRSFTWEKGSAFGAFEDGSPANIKQFYWVNDKDSVYFTENGLFYSSDKCYRITDPDDIAEIWDMLYANITDTEPEFRLAESITKGCVFRNMTGTYKAQFKVPAEVSVSGQSFVIDSEGTAYVDRENGGAMLEGSGTVSYNNKAETERYAYLKYPDGKVRYDEAKGDGESTAHYKGVADVFSMLDYSSLYKQVTLDINSYNEADSNEFITDKDNGDGTHLYAFTWTTVKEKTTVKVTVNEQGKIISYIMLNGDGNVIKSFELSDDCVFDSDDFAMPEMYKINAE